MGIDDHKSIGFLFFFGAVILIGACAKPLGGRDSSESVNAPFVGYSFSIPDTGQVESYDDRGNLLVPDPGEDFFGQDAQYHGTPFSFVDGDDGTITDNITHLIWQKVPARQRFSWADAKAYCQSLSLAGIEDWRVPSLKELVSIEDFSKGWPYLDTNYFDPGGEKLSQDLQFWSSNVYKVDTAKSAPNLAFGLNFATGHIKGYPASDLTVSDRRPEMFDSIKRPARRAAKMVRCVYGYQYGLNHFVDNGDKTITDRATGLMWAKFDSEQGLDWKAALSYAENLELAGYTDWRLPNIKELQSIVDYSGVYPAIDGDFFSISDDDAYFWSSTSAYHSKRDDERSKMQWAWYVAFGFAIDADGNDRHGAGAMRYDAKAENSLRSENSRRIYNYVRPVRSS